MARTVIIQSILQVMINFQEYSALYKQELLSQVIPFWEKYSIDSQCGGFYTCLDQKGNVYDTDKFIWLQGRQTWVFSMLYNQMEKRQKWLDIALHGADFLIKYGRNKEGLWYFSLTRQGKPIEEPHSIFSDCFAAMAFAELYKATHNQIYKQISRQTFYNILKRQQNPESRWSRDAGGRKLISLTLPMILCNLSLIVQNVVGKAQIEALIKPIIETIMTKFWDKQHNLLFENRGPNGEFIDCFEGRLISAGNVNEAMWFILDLAQKFKDEDLKNKCTNILINTTKFAWDDKFQGLFYFNDIKGHPVQQLEWDQKLWWVHIETMISLLKAYKATKRQECLEWFKKLHDYTWEKFRDDLNKGEWWGYLNREGEVLLRLKGGKWKGCYHVPRGLFQLYKTCEQLQK